MSSPDRDTFPKVASSQSPHAVHVSRQVQHRLLLKDPHPFPRLADVVVAATQSVEHDPRKGVPLARRGGDHVARPRPGRRHRGAPETPVDALHGAATPSCRSATWCWDYPMACSSAPNHPIGCPLPLPLRRPRGTAPQVGRHDVGLVGTRTTNQSVVDVAVQCTLQRTSELVVNVSLSIDAGPSSGEVWW